MNKKVLVAGGGGFIGGHFVRRMLDEGFQVTVADIKPREEWYQIHDDAENHFSTTMSRYENVVKVMQGCHMVFNFSCNMGGIGFCENNHLMTGLSVEVNTNMVKAAMNHKPELIFYSSSACVYNEDLQKDTNNPGLKEEDAWPAQPDLLYGLEKLFSEQLYKYLYKEFGIPVYIARLHNVYGPLGTWDGGREKAPAATLRKVIAMAKGDNPSNKITIWGDGEQTRSFMHIDDCVDGIMKIINEPKLLATPVNLGSDEMVSIKQLYELAAELASVIPDYSFDLSAPKGVRGRNSDNTYIKKILNWAPSIRLKTGMKKTYDWLYKDYDDKNSPFRMYHDIRW